jgi:Ca2+-binding RTX toxin-like protein
MNMKIANVAATEIQAPIPSLEAIAGAAEVEVAPSAPRPRCSPLHDILSAGGDDIGEFLSGGDGSDTLPAGAGDDHLAPGGGNDVVDGGFGFDILTYWNYEASGSSPDIAGAVVDLGLGIAQDPWGGRDQIAGIEGVEGTSYADTLTGDSGGNRFEGLDGNDLLTGRGGRDTLLGGAGDDSLYGDGMNDVCEGGSGADWLYGGAGNDILTGGSGQDGFLFDTKPDGKTNMDRILDFRPVDDTIYLAASAFTKLKVGGLGAGAFAIGAKAKDAGDRIIYDQKTGSLFYDPDGTGKASQVKFATVTKHLKLSHSDFDVY